MARTQESRKNKGSSTMSTFRGLGLVVVLALLLAASSSNAAPALDRRNTESDLLKRSHADVVEAVRESGKRRSGPSFMETENDALVKRSSGESQAWAQQSSFFVSISSAMKIETKKLAEMTKRAEPTGSPQYLMRRDDTNQGTTDGVDSAATLTSTAAGPSMTASADDGTAAAVPTSSASGASSTSSAPSVTMSLSTAVVSGGAETVTEIVTVTDTMSPTASATVPAGAGTSAASIAAMNATATTTATAGAATAIPSPLNATQHDGKHRMHSMVNSTMTHVHHHQNYTAAISHTHHHNYTATASHSHHHQHEATQSPTTSLPLFTSMPTTFTLGTSYNTDAPASTISNTTHHHKHHHHTEKTAASSVTAVPAKSKTDTVSPVVATSSPDAGAVAASDALVPSGYVAITILVPDSALESAMSSTAVDAAYPTRGPVVETSSLARRSNSNNAFPDVNGNSYSVSKASSSSSRSQSAQKTSSSKASSATATAGAHRLDADTSNNIDTPPLLRSSGTAAATSTSTSSTATATPTSSYYNDDEDDCDESSTSTADDDDDCDDSSSSSNSASRRALAELDGLF